MNWTGATTPRPQRLGLALTAEGMGDCLFAMAVIRKLRQSYAGNPIDLFTWHPALFKACPYVDTVQLLDDAAVKGYSGKMVRLFEPEKNPHWKMDTFDFISVPVAQGQLTFAEKQLEY